MSGLGRLVHWKGYHLAIAAFARIAARHPDATFTNLGDGPQRARLERLIEEAGLTDRVRLDRWRPRSEAVRVVDDSDIFLFASLHDSGGSSVLEAMAAGKPVICLDTGGPAVLVTPDSGIKVPVRMPQQVVTDLAQALDRLLSNPVLRQKMGDAAQRRVLEEFVWERKAEKMLAVYQEVMASSSSTAPCLGDSPSRNTIGREHAARDSSGCVGC